MGPRYAGASAAFSHPDCHRRPRTFTESGHGLAAGASRAFTAGGDFHPAPKASITESAYRRLLLLTVLLSR